MLKLKRLRIERFRSLVKGTELLFSDGINVVLGQNGTGKTTLLELISMVVRSDFRSLSNEEFAVEYELSAPGGENIAVIIRNDRVVIDQVASVDLGERQVFRPSAELLGSIDRRLLLRYEAEHGLSRPDATPVGGAGIPTPLQRGFLYFFVSLVKFPIERFANYLLQQQSNTYRLDESLDLFRGITHAGELAGNILVAGSSWFLDPFSPPFVPFSLVDELKASYQSMKPDYSFTHNNLELLSSIKNMMDFEACDLRIDVSERRLDPTPTQIVQLSNLVFRFWWKDKSFITQERLSYGQRRLLMFFYYLACNPAIVIADELVNGLHHRWITASIEAIEQRQAFLTSQNPLLLDYIPITSAEEVRRSFVLCRGVPREGRPGWVWENMSEDDARELYSAYEVGVEHVSEILQSRGLW